MAINANFWGTWVYFTFLIFQFAYGADDSIPVSYVSPALVGENVLLNCSLSDNARSAGYWRTPNGTYLSLTAGQVDRFKILFNGSLIIDSVGNDDVGTYTCFGGSIPTSGATQSQKVILPYLIPSPDYGVKTGIAFGASGAFLLSVLAIWAIDKFGHRSKVGPADEDIQFHLNQDTMPRKGHHSGSKKGAGDPVTPTIISVGAGSVENISMNDPQNHQHHHHHHNPDQGHHHQHHQQSGDVINGRGYVPETRYPPRIPIRNGAEYEADVESRF